MLSVRLELTPSLREPIVAVPVSHVLLIPSLGQAPLLASHALPENMFDLITRVRYPVLCAASVRTPTMAVPAPSAELELIQISREGTPLLFACHVQVESSR